jgi:hypothetical protein
MGPCHGSASLHGGLAFTARSVHMGFVLDKVALGQVFLPVLRFSLVSIIPPMLHIYSCRPIIWGVDNGPVSTPVP